MPVDQIPIGKFSFMTRLSQKALRLYDRKGLLVPEAKDPFTGYRYYTVSQLEKGMKIKTLDLPWFFLRGNFQASGRGKQGELRVYRSKFQKET